MTTDPILPDILAEIVRTQKQRRANWQEYYEPTDPDLERVHMAKLNALKAEIAGTERRTICTRRKKSRAA